MITLRNVTFWQGIAWALAFGSILGPAPLGLAQLPTVESTHTGAVSRLVEDETIMDDQILFGDPPEGDFETLKFIAIEHFGQNTYYNIYAVDDFYWEEGAEFNSYEEALAAVAFSHGWFAPEWSQPTPSYADSQMAAHQSLGFVSSLSTEVMVGRFQTQDGFSYRIVIDKTRMMLTSDGALEGSSFAGPIDLFAVLDVYPIDTPCEEVETFAARLADMRDCEPWGSPSGKLVNHDPQTEAACAAGPPLPDPSPRSEWSPEAKECALEISKCNNRHRRSYHLEIVGCEADLDSDLRWNLLCLPLALYPWVAPVCTGLVTSAFVSKHVRCVRRALKKWKIRISECREQADLCCHVYSLCYPA